MAIRLLSSCQNCIHDCNLHPDLRKFLDAKSGLLIVSGPTGSGKMTTIAALIEEINRSQRRHVIMVDSPIEYAFRNRKSFSQILSAIQAGGEAGMWSFDRYAHWIETKRDWARPAQAALLDEDPHPPLPESETGVSPWKKDP